MMKLKRVISLSLALIGLSVPVQAANHTVVKGDTYWTISKQYGVDFNTLLKANNATSSSWLEIGDVVYVPTGKTHIVSKGDTYWLIAQWYNVDFNALLKENNATTSSWLEVGDVVSIPSVPSSSPTNSKPYVTYSTYKVKSGDTYWSIANDHGIPMEELLETNGLNENSSIYVGKKLTIPVHHVPVTSTPGAKYGEYLNWWDAAQYVIPVGATFTVQDYYTGQSFKAKRTTGSGHADCEPLTSSDTSKMNSIFGGQNWTSRPVVIIYNGRKIAASATSKLHAGNDGAPGGVWTSWRSDNYGAGYNFDWVKGNNAHGVFDIHFLNSIRHSDGKVHSTHQKNVRTAAGR